MFSWCATTWSHPLIQAGPTSPACNMLLNFAKCQIPFVSFIFLSHSTDIYIYILTRGPKLLSMYTVEQRGFLILKYWQTSSFKACQMTFRTEFGGRRAPSKCSIQKLVKKLETRGSRSNACRLFFGAYWRAKCIKIHPRTVEQLKDAVRQEIQAVNVNTLGKYSRICRNAFKCAWMWKETSFSIDYEQVLFCIVPGMCI